MRVYRCDAHEKYEEAWVTTQEIVQQDVWVLDKQKH